MNYRRGLFRTWIILSVIWSAVALIVTFPETPDWEYLRIALKYRDFQLVLWLWRGWILVFGVGTQQPRFEGVAHATHHCSNAKHKQITSFAIL